MTPEQKTETLDHIADRIAYKYLDKTVASAKLKSEILSALRNERERCAKVADAVEAEWITHARNIARADDLVGGLAQSAYNNKAEIANGIAKAIREGR